jgi:hypothetical protein
MKKFTFIKGNSKVEVESNEEKNEAGQFIAELVFKSINLADDTAELPEDEKAVVETARAIAAINVEPVE